MMPSILALETGGALLSVAVHHKGKIASLVSHEMTYGHAKAIVPTAQAALAQASCDFAMLTHIAAGTGPGSFTGIRVALSCAKGFCLAWGAVGIGVSGLQALASNAARQGHNEGAPMLITADTRRGALYCQFFDAEGQAKGTIFEAEPAGLPALRRTIEEEASLYIGGFDDGQLGRIFAADGVRVIQPAQTVRLDAAMIANDANRHIVSGTLMPLTPLYLAAAKLGPKKAEKPNKDLAKTDGPEKDEPEKDEPETNKTKVIPAAHGWCR
jgi:tRNA threonylcarbamoyl adenosine modification protein YeaZ